MTTYSMDISDSGEVSQKRWWKEDRRKWVLIALAAILLVTLLGLLGYFIAEKSSSKPALVDPENYGPPSYSKLQTFKRAAICTDGPPCSEIGKNVLENNGSAVDAAVAAAFCNGLINMASLGLGGGFFMTIYIKSEEKVYVVNSRETAPKLAHEKMFTTKDQAAKGGLAVGTPGEVSGLWAIHQRWGRLPWKQLVEPSVGICRSGFNMSKVLYDVVSIVVHKGVMADPNLRKMFFDEKTNKFYREGAHVYPHATLCETLQRIAEQGGPDFYTGALAKDVAEDIKDAGGIVSLDDLKNYTTQIKEPLSIELSNGDTLYTPPPPSSGVLLGMILNVLSGYNFTRDSISSVNATVLTYHRIIEAFKFAYATRSLLGDIDFLPGLADILSNVTTKENANLVRSKISDARTFGDPLHYGANFTSTADAGTAHMSIIAPDGDAVSTTSSINYYFGAGFTGKRTGIIFNNVMDDFSSANFANYFNVPPSPANYIQPRKRPLSSMSPAIILDANKNAKLVIGASGGTMITTAVAAVIMKTLWMERSVKEAVDSPRIHHQLFPPTVSYEYGNIAGVIQGLKVLGHNMTRYTERGSIVCVLFRNRTGIYGNADHRKGGVVYGLD